MQAAQQPAGAASWLAASARAPRRACGCRRGSASDRGATAVPARCREHDDGRDESARRLGLGSPRAPSSAAMPRSRSHRRARHQVRRRLRDGSERAATVARWRRARSRAHRRPASRSGSDRRAPSRAASGSAARGRARSATRLDGGAGASNICIAMISPAPPPMNGGSPTTHLVEDAAERVEVRAVIDRAGRARLLGRHVERRAHQRAGLRVPGFARLVDELRDAEVEDLRTLADGVSGSGTRNMLSGLRSRWTMPLACAAASALAMPRAISHGLAIGQPAARRESLRQRLAVEQLHHEVRATVAGVPKSKISTMPGCRIALAAFASLKNRATSSAFAAQPGAQHLHRGRPFRGSRAARDRPRPCRRR